MSFIPLDLQRRFEQRWAAKYASPIAPAAAKCIVLKDTIGRLPRPAKAKEKPAELSQQACSVLEPAGLLAVTG
jgi:hypothetical protein